MNKYVGIGLIALLLVSLIGGCSNSEPALYGGVLVTFDVNGET